MRDIKGCLVAFAALCLSMSAQAQLAEYNRCHSKVSVVLEDTVMTEECLRRLEKAFPALQVELCAPYNVIVVSTDYACSDQTWLSSLNAVLAGLRYSILPAISQYGHVYSLTGDVMVLARTSFTDELSQDLAALNCEIEVHPSIKDHTMLIASPNDHRTFEDVLTNMQAHPGVVSAYPSRFIPIKDHLAVDDPDYSDQWFLPAIHADQAWDITTGSSSVIVAVLDHGFQTNHPDITGKVTNPYDAVNDDYVLSAPSANNDHGTPCMGLIAAKTNNSIGVASVGFNIKVMPVDIKLLNNTLTSDPILQRAATHVSSIPNVAAVSNSYGDNAAYAVYYEQMRLNSRGGLGAVIVGSMGNDGSSNNSNYPAWHPNVVAVAGTDASDQRAANSNYGSMTHVSAPYYSYTIDIGSTYDDFNGTSASCPIVAGIIGLMASVNPSLTELELRQFLEATCDKVGGYSYATNGNYPNGTWSNELGYGRVNAYAAVVAAGGVQLNDGCAGAIELVSGTSCSYTPGTVDGANPDGFPLVPSCDDADTNPSCTGTPSRHGVFYRFTAVSTSHVITVDPLGSGGGSLDAVVTIYEGPNCFNLDEVACEDVLGGAGLTTILAHNAFVPGNEYWIRVYDWCTVTALTNGDFQICITHQNSEDITVESISPLQPSYTPGQTIAINCEQCYSGSTPELDLPNPNIIAYLSTTCDPADALDSDNESSGIGSDDECNQENFALDIPLGTPAGTYYIVIVADANDEVEEGSGENNNTECVPVTIGQGCTTPAVPTPVFGSASCPGPSMSSAIPLEWNPVPGAVGYRLRVGIYPYEEGIFIDVGAGDCYAGTSYSIPALFTTGIPCYWSVSAFGECGNELCQSAYSAPRYFSVPPVVLAANGTTICDGESAELSLETFWVVDAPGTNSAQWYRDGVAIPGATGGTYAATQSGGYSVVLTFTGSLWCPDPVVLGPSNTVQVVEDNLDTDGDGVPNCTDNCPNVFGQIGSSCNDGNACTTNDQLNSSCSCVGTPLADTDADGLCDLIDPCPTLANIEPGDACNDGNANTGNDVYQVNCICAGQLIDCLGVPGGTATIGSACNDGNANTGNDVYGMNCVCAGQLIDCLGVPGGTATIGSACNDGNANTGNDVYGANCICAGQLIDCLGVPGGTAVIGSACNDGNTNTGNDVYGANCVCAGQLIDCLGVPGGTATVGSACDDGNANTGNDVYGANCVCAGQLIDCLGVPGGTATIGSPCDDGNANTGNDVYGANCVCAGQLIDCLGVPGGTATIGSSCDDNNPNSTNDVYGANCVCAGTLANDCLGVPGGPAQPGTPCDDGLATTGNDTWSANCVCEGQLIDCLGVPGGTATIGSACDDNNPNSTNDVYGANCVCAGTLANDCLGVPGGPAQPGTPCDDGLATTGNDTWSANCACIGEVIDCEGVPGGAALPGTACDDLNPNSTNDLWSANCVCAGTLPNDCLGVPGGAAQPGTPCDDSNPGTINDTWTAGCICVGEFILDCEGVPGGPDQPGSPCDDGDINTGNDNWSVDCLCEGQPLDCEGTPGGTALPGTDCDDGDVLTADEFWDLNCICGGGTSVDCEGTPGGSALPGTTCDDGNPNTGNDTWLSTCECEGDTSTWVTEVETSTWFTIHPNPSNGIFQVTPAGSNVSAIDIRVFDGLGQLVTEPVILTGSQPQRLDLHEKANGLYFLRATRGSESQVLELIIQR